MAAAKKSGDTVRLVHSGGATVVVPAEKGERILSTGVFSTEDMAASADVPAKRSAAKSDDKS